MLPRTALHVLCCRSPALARGDASRAFASSLRGRGLHPALARPTLNWPPPPLRFVAALKRTPVAGIFSLANETRTSSEVEEGAHPHSLCRTPAGGASFSVAAAAAVGVSASGTAAGGAQAAAAAADEVVKSVASLQSSFPPGLPRGEYADLASIPAGSYLDPSVAVSTIELGESWFAGPAMQLISFVHDVGGLEWWAAIVGTTLGLRLLIMPMYFSSIRAAARLQEHTPALQHFMKNMTTARASGDTNAVREAAMQRVAYVRKHQVQVWRIFAPFVFQMPIFIGLFSACRRFAIEAALFPGMLTGGTAWFTALHVPDPHGILLAGLPLLSAAFAGGSVLLNNNINGMPNFNLSPAGQRLFFFCLSTFFSLATVGLPASVQLYIAATSATMVIQQGLLRSAAFRAAIGIPASWPPTGAKLAEIHKRSAAMLGPMAQAASVYAPLFRAFSHVGDALARRDWKTLRRNPFDAGAARKQTYVGFLGLRDPGPAPPPAQENAAAAGAVTQGSPLMRGSGGGAEGRAAALAPPAAAAAAGSTRSVVAAVGVGAPSMPVLQAPAVAAATAPAGGKPVLYMHRPPKRK